MTPTEIAAKAADEVMGVIERNKRIVKADIAEAIEEVLLTRQVTALCYLQRPALNIDMMALLGFMRGYAGLPEAD
jgi:hypothetical protein